MFSTRTRVAAIATIALTSAATLGLASAATAADVVTYPIEVIPGVTVVSGFPDYVLEVDCAEFEGMDSYGPVDLMWVPGGSAELRFSCSSTQGAFGSLDSGLDADGFPFGVTSLGPIPGSVETIAMDPNTAAEFTFPSTEVFQVNYFATLRIDDPSGELLFTEDLTTPADGVQAVTFDSDSDNFCEIDDVRVYAALDFTVLEGGDFTFRIVGVDPQQGGEFGGIEWTIDDPNPWGDYMPINDPFLVIYSDFDPAQPDANQIACNDDTESNPGTETYFSRDSEDRYISDRFSELVAELSPGQYTLVLTTYDSSDPVVNVSAPVKLDAAALPLAPVDYDLEGLPAQSATVELWGTQGGLVLGHAAVLADTGADSRVSTGLAAGALLSMLAGAIAIAVVRRRAAAVAS